MKNTEEDLPVNPDQSAIINQDAVFENSSVDPGFVFEESKDDLKKDLPKDADGNTKKDEEGTNPGSNQIC